LPPALFCVTMGAMMSLMATRVWLITGERQVGKSTVLGAVIPRLREAHVCVTGLLTERTGPHDLAVTELHTGDRYPLTEPFRDLPGSPTRQFTMSEDALARSRQALVTSFPTQLFVLDELGPLELNHRRGWVVALDLLARARYDLAVVVVRPELLGAAITALPDVCFCVLQVTLDNRAALPERLVEAWLARLAEPALSQPGAWR